MDSNAACSPADALPDWLDRVDGLDTAAGLRHCGAAEAYLNSLRIYAETAEPNIAQIEAYRRAGDLGGVTTKVHALKSTSRAVGAAELGAFAARLEAASRAGDEQVLLAELDELLARCRALARQLAPLLAKAEEDASLPLIAAERLREAYAEILELSEAFDFDGVASVLEALGAYRIPEGERERFDRLVRAVDDFDWDQIGGILA